MTKPVSPSEIISELPKAFIKARESGDLLFFPSTVYKHTDRGVEFELRLCPALQSKPHVSAPYFDPSETERKTEACKQADPFSPPYNTNLLVGELRDERENLNYVVLFNKFSVVPHHILLVTKEFQSQASPLLPCDLCQAYQLLVAARNAGRRFFAFYNCGCLSGASQPHKHLQLLPLEEDGPPIEKLARAANLEVPDRPFSLSILPYANHIRRLPSSLQSASPAELEGALCDAFISLLDLVISTVRRDPTYPAGPPSYNFLLTLEHMHLIPRREEMFILKETGEPLSVNAMGYAGMLLVKSEQELEAVKKEGVARILRGVGLESVHDLQLNESFVEPELATE